MKLGMATLALLVFCSTALRADVTLTMTIAAERAGVPAGASIPRMTLHIQGLKSRSETEVMGRIYATIVDIEGRQIVMLDGARRTAQVLRTDALKNAVPPAAMPPADVSVEPTGQSRSIAGQSCDEFKVTMAMDFGQLGMAMPPQAVEMMKGVTMRLKGVMWVSKSVPGAAEYIAFQKAARGMNVPATPSPLGNSVDPLIGAFAAAEGMPCLTEMETSFEGTGPMVETLKQVGAMKIVTNTTGVSIAPIAADAFVIPSDYTVTGQ